MRRHLSILRNILSYNMADSGDIFKPRYHLNALRERQRGKESERDRGRERERERERVTV